MVFRDIKTFFQFQLNLMMKIFCTFNEIICLKEIGVYYVA